MDGSIESFGIGEGLVGQMKGFEIVPDHFDVVEFGRVLGQPFDGEPVGTGRKGSGCRLAHVDRPVVEHDDDGFRRQTRPRAILSAMKSVLRLVRLVCTMSLRAV